MARGVASRIFQNFEWRAAPKSDPARSPSGIQQVDESSHAERKRCGRGRFNAESPFSIKSHA